MRTIFGLFLVANSDCAYNSCIPYRLREDKEDCSGNIENRIQVLMVSSPNRNDLVFPKGGWEDDENVLEAACREALEEAGVKGILRKTPLGIWEFRSKSRQNICSQEGGCKGYMFALEVTEELDTWPEQGNRDRKWVNTKEAFKLCRYEWMREALEKFVRVIAEDKEVETREETQIVENLGHLALPLTLPLPLQLPVSDVVVGDCQMIASNCYVKTSSSHHHVIASFPWHCAPQEVATDMSY
ncbi:nudix hydrolase 13, mitochondrial isoform X2 [Ziziphus jujuba]|uniref:Nudix hydrolase 13, mitochondrial isoform X2 n=1 Tax=Ziziphus jujuba TaxID=326968 RepID=A0A6P6GI56_ZIZJJ|nr:nudix hydrolase 13, mitochondrial isoform X2 [Ziziphus jujuba]